MQPSGKVSTRPWGSTTAADYQDAGAYCDACLINENTGPRSKWSKNACKLPVYEPNGDLNRNAVGAIAAILSGGRGGVQASVGAKRAAARKLLALYGRLSKALGEQRTPPDAVRRMAA